MGNSIPGSLKGCSGTYLNNLFLYNIAGGATRKIICRMTTNVNILSTINAPLAHFLIPSNMSFREYSPLAKKNLYTKTSNGYEDKNGAEY